MISIEEYHRDFISTTSDEAAFNDETEDVQYLENVTSILEQYDVCPRATPCFFERRGSQKSIISIHGYSDSTDDGGLSDNTLSIFYCDYTNKHEIETINKKRYNELVEKCLGFVTDSVNGYIEKHVDVSDPGYALAQNIRMNFEEYDRIKIFIVTDKIPTTKFKELREESILNKKTITRLIDFSLFYSQHVSNKTHEELVINISNYGIDGIPCIEATENSLQTPCMSYMGVIPGYLLAIFYKDYGSILLESNVRSFLTAKTGVNKGIKKTIQSNPEMFFAYNNGVALTATDVIVDKTNNIITQITNLQIVNGGQTTVSLFKELKNGDPSNLNKIFVPMKLTVVNSTNSVEIIHNISQFANTQNAVKESDLDSNSDFQKAMEAASRRVRVLGTRELGRRFWYYERTRGQYIQESTKGTDAQNNLFKKEYSKERFMDKIEFAKYRCMYQQQPHIVSKGGQTCYSIFTSQIAEDWDKNKDHYNDEYFKETACIAILYKKVYASINTKRCPWFGGSFRSQIAYYTLPKFFYMLEQRNVALNIREIWDTQSVDESIISQMMVIGKVFLDQLKEVGNNGGNPTQWCKKEECWKSFKAVKIEFNDNVLKHTITATESEKEKQEAAIEQREIEGDLAISNLALFNDWRKVKQLMMRNDYSIEDQNIIQDVINYLNDPIHNRITPKRAIRALEIRKNIVD